MESLLTDEDAEKLLSPWRWLVFSQLGWVVECWVCGSMGERVRGVGVGVAGQMGSWGGKQVSETNEGTRVRQARGSQLREFQVSKTNEGTRVRQARGSQFREFQLM